MGGILKQPSAGAGLIIGLGGRGNKGAFAGQHAKVKQIYHVPDLFFFNRIAGFFPGLSAVTRGKKVSAYG